MQRITRGRTRRRKAAGLRKVLRCGRASWKIMVRASVLMWLMMAIRTVPSSRKPQSTASPLRKSATSKLARRAGLRRRTLAGASGWCCRRTLAGASGWYKNFSQTIVSRSHCALRTHSPSEFTPMKGVSHDRLSVRCHAGPARGRPVPGRDALHPRGAHPGMCRLPGRARSIGAERRRRRLRRASAPPRPERMAERPRVRDRARARPRAVRASSTWRDSPASAAWWR